MHSFNRRRDGGHIHSTGEGMVDTFIQQEKGWWVHSFNRRRDGGYIHSTGEGMVDTFTQQEKGWWTHSFNRRRDGRYMAPSLWKVRHEVQCSPHSMALAENTIHVEN